MTARKAIFEKFRLLGLVNKAYSAMKDEYDLPTMTGGELSTFATGVGISLMRGESLPESVFADVKEAPKPKPQPKEESFEEGMEDEDIPFEQPPVTKPAAQGAKPQSTKALGWKTFMHPKRQIPLGEIDEADLLGFTRWALCCDADQLEGVHKNFYANVMLMAAEKRWDTPVSCLTNSLAMLDGYGDTFQDEHIDAACVAGYQVPLADLDDEAAVDILGDFNGFVEKVMSQASKPKKATKAAMPD